MIRVFLDTNALFDFLDKKRQKHLEAIKLERAVSKNGGRLFCALHSLSILEYVYRKKLGLRETHAMIERTIAYIEIPAVGTVGVRAAFNYLSSDFEDALQITSALEANADYIATRNVADFAKSPIPVLLPEELTRVLSK